MKTKIKHIISTIENRILTADPKDFILEDILTGKLGLIHSCYHIYKQNKDEKYLNKIIEILEDIFENLGKQESKLTQKMALADGLPGLGLVLHKLVKEGILDVDYQVQIDTITDTIFKKCKYEVTKANFDYFYGSIGLLFYLYSVDADKELSEIVSMLYTYADNNDYRFYNNVDDVYSQGINFGFAHGSLAILSILTRVHQRGIQKEKTEILLSKITLRLLAFRKGTLDQSKVNIMHEGYDYPSIFPYNVTTSDAQPDFNLEAEDNLYHFTDRLGWCNSDLSRMYMLFKLGDFLDNDMFVDVANEMTDEVISRKLEKDTAIKDCYICHGSSGVAHLYKKIFEMTNNPVFEEAYQHWIEVTVNYMEDEMKKTPSDRDLEMLTGWLGPFFVLSSYTGKKYPDWDDIFLLN